MKKLVTLVLVLAIFSGVMVGCAPADDSTPETTPVVVETESGVVEVTQTEGEDKPPFKLGMLIPGSPTDGGFCQLGAEAARAIEEHFGCEITIIEAATANLMVTEAEALIEDGYDIIFGHGGQYNAPFGEISSEYPDTIFITQGGTIMTENVIPAFMAFEEACYLAGILIANLSETGNMGMVVGGDFPSYTKTTNALMLGAQSVNPDFKYQHAVLTNIDMNEAYETTMNQIHGGADFVFSNANQGTLGSLKAAADSPDVYAIGALADYSGEFPDTVMVSAICDYNRGYIATVEKALAGFKAGEYIRVGIADNVGYLAWNDDLKSLVPDDVMAQIDEAEQKIIDGEIIVPGDLDDLAIMH